MEGPSSEEGKARGLEGSRLWSARKGHFRLESGDHGELWLDLESLCFRTEPIGEIAGELAARMSGLGIEVVCGPLVEGAFVALLVAQRLGVGFTYSRPERDPGPGGPPPVTYRIPGGLRSRVTGLRVAVVDDVINAGSAVRGTLVDLRECGARAVAIGALAVLGRRASSLAAGEDLPLVTLQEIPSRIWAPAECPLCAGGVPLTDEAGVGQGEARPVTETSHGSAKQRRRRPRR